MNENPIFERLVKDVDLGTVFITRLGESQIKLKVTMVMMEKVEDVGLVGITLVLTGNNEVKVFCDDFIQDISQHHKGCKFAYKVLNTNDDTVFMLIG